MYVYMYVFYKIFPFMRQMEKNCGTWQFIDGNKLLVHCMLDK